MIERLWPNADSRLGRIGDEAKHMRNAPLLVGIRHRLQRRRGERDDEIVSAARQLLRHRVRRRQVAFGIEAAQLQ